MDRFFGHAMENYMGNENQPSDVVFNDKNMNLKNISKLNENCIEFVESLEFLNVNAMLDKYELFCSNIGYAIKTSVYADLIGDSGIQNNAQEFGMDSTVGNFTFISNSEDTLSNEYSQGELINQVLYPNIQEERFSYNMEMGANAPNSEDRKNEFQQHGFIPSIRRYNNLDMQISSKEIKTASFSTNSEMTHFMLITELETANTFYYKQKENAHPINQSISMSDQTQDYGKCGIRHESAISNEDRNIVEKGFVPKNFSENEDQLNIICLKETQTTLNISLTKKDTSGNYKYVPIHETLKRNKTGEKGRNSKNNCHDITTTPNVQKLPLNDMFVSKVEKESAVKEIFLPGPSQDTETISILSANGSLNNRYEMHDRERPFTDDANLKDLKHMCNFNNNMKTLTGQKRHECKICKKVFSIKSHLVLHNRSHTGVKPFICNICHNEFSHKNILVQHSRIHKGEKSFSCEFCHKAFSRKGDLKRHFRIHSGDKPFSCSICNKAFRRQNYLKTHMFTHTGEKPFSCDICDKTFRQRNHLKTHMFTHSGEKPFQCEHCERSFSSKRNLSKHQRTHQP